MASTILLCTDGSELAIRALRAGLARLAPADHYVLAVVLEPVDPTLMTGVSGMGAGVMSPQQLQAIDEGQRNDGEAALTDTAQALGLHDVESRVLYGHVGQELCALAESISADAMVLGTRGHGGLRRAVLGSVSDHIVRHAPCTVVITAEAATS
jgi:nucleotide-binding universal stress UspA family protein